MKKITTMFLAALAAVSMQGGQASADIVSSTSEPTTNVLVDELGLGGATGTLINASATQGARGTQFSVGLSGELYDISGFAIRAANADTFTAGETFTVALYSGTAGAYTAAGSFANVTPAYLDANTGLSLIGSETFAADSITGSSTAGQVSGNDYVTFNFTSDIQVGGGADITAMVFSNFAFSQREGNGNGGGRLQFRENSTSLNASGSRDLSFSVIGTVAVPEPTSLAVLGLASVVMVARRRRR